MMHHSQGHHHLHDAAGAMDYRRFSVDNNQLHHHHHHPRSCTCKLCWPLNPYSTPSRTISPLPEHLMKPDWSCSHHIPNPNPTPLRPGFLHGVDKSEGGYHASAGRSPSFSVAPDCFISPRHLSDHSFYHHSEHGYVPRTPNTNEFNVGFNLQREPKLFSPVMFDKSREIIQENPVLASMMSGHTESISQANQVTLYNWYLIRCSTDSEVAVGGYLNPGTVRTEKMETSAIVQRLQKCQLITKDSLEVHLMGLIDDYTTVQNGFSIDIIHSFLSGFPYTWNHLLNNEFRMSNAKNSVCPGHSLCAVESTQVVINESSSQENNIPTHSSKVAEVTDFKGVEDDKNEAEEDPSTENLEVAQVRNEHVMSDEPRTESLLHGAFSENEVDRTPVVTNIMNDIGQDNPYEEEFDSSKDNGKCKKNLDDNHDQLPEAQMTEAPQEKSNTAGIGESSQTMKKARVSTRITRSMQRLGKHLDFVEDQPPTEGEILSPGEPRTPISPKSHRKSECIKLSRSITRSSKKDCRGSVNADDSPSVGMQSNVEDVKSAVKSMTESENNIKDELLSTQDDQNASNIEIVKIEQPSEGLVQSVLCKETGKHERSGTESTPFDFDNVPRKKDEDDDTTTEMPMEVSLKEDDCNSKTPERLISMKTFPVGLTSKSASLSSRQVEETSVAKDEEMSVNEVEVSTTVDQIDTGELESVVETIEEPKLSTSAKANHKRMSRTNGKAKTPRRRPTEFKTPDSSRKTNASANGIDEIREVKEESTIMKASKLPPPLPKPRVSVSKELVSEAFGLKTSRSGRILVPPLAHWCGQSLLRDKDGGIIAISDGSSDGKSVSGGDYKFKPPAEAELKKLQKRLQEAAIEYSAKKKSRKQ